MMEVATSRGPMADGGVEGGGWVRGFVYRGLLVCGWFDTERGKSMYVVKVCAQVTFFVCMYVCNPEFFSLNALYKSSSHRYTNSPYIYTHIHSTPSLCPFTLRWQSYAKSQIIRRLCVFVYVHEAVSVDRLCFPHAISAKPDNSPNEVATEAQRLRV